MSTRLNTSSTPPAPPTATTVVSAASTVGMGAEEGVGGVVWRIIIPTSTPDTGEAREALREENVRGLPLLGSALLSGRLSMRRRPSTAATVVPEGTSRSPTGPGVHTSIPTATSFNRPPSASVTVERSSPNVKVADAPIAAAIGALRVTDGVVELYAATVVPAGMPAPDTD